MRATLVEYERRLKERFRHRYELEVQLWAMLAPYQKRKSDPPKPHPLLDE